MCFGPGYNATGFARDGSSMVLLVLLRPSHYKTRRRPIRPQFSCVLVALSLGSKRGNRARAHPTLRVAAEDSKIFLSS